MQPGRRFLCLVVLLTAGAAPCARANPSENPCPQLRELNTGSEPDNEVLRYFPGTKPFSRGKAYVWWRARSMAPDAVFDGIFMSPEQLRREAVRIGGYVVGHTLRHDGSTSGLSTELSAGRRGQLETYLRAKPVLLETGAEELKPFAPVAEAAVRKHGSIAKLLSSLDITLEMTPSKQRELQRGENARAGGKYIIDSEGRTYFLSEADMAKLQRALSLPGVNHGAIGALLFHQRGDGKPVRIVDYGDVVVRPGRNPAVEVEPYQSHWNEGRADFDSREFLLRD